MKNIGSDIRLKVFDEGKINKRNKTIDPTYYNRDYYKYADQYILRDRKVPEIDFIMEGISSIKNKKILEIGCGTGSNLELFAKNNIVYGIDYSKDAIYLSHEKGIDSSIGSADAIPVRDRWADIILILDVIEHLEPFRYKKLIHEIDRILAINGNVIINTPLRDRLPIFIRGIYNKIMKLDEPYYFEAHINELTLKEIIYSFSSINLEIKKSKISNLSSFKINETLGYFFGGGITASLERRYGNE